MQLIAFSLSLKFQYDLNILSCPLKNKILQKPLSLYILENAISNYFELSLKKHSFFVQ